MTEAIETESNNVQNNINESKSENNMADENQNAEEKQASFEKNDASDIDNVDHNIAVLDDDKTIEKIKELGEGDETETVEQNESGYKANTEPLSSSPPIDSNMLLEEEEEDYDGETTNKNIELRVDAGLIDNDINHGDDNISTIEIIDEEKNKDEGDKILIDKHVSGGIKKNDSLEKASEDSKVTPIFTNNINKATNDVFENFRESAIEINGGENENIECSEEEKDEIIHTGQDNTTRKVNIKNVDFDAISDEQMLNTNETSSQLRNNKSPRNLNPHSTDGYVETPRELLSSKNADDDGRSGFKFQPEPSAVPIKSMEEMIKARELDEEARLDELKKRNEIKLLKEQQCKAALKIQTMARGKLARREVTNIRILKNNAAIKIQKHGRKFYAKNKVEKQRKKIELEKQRKQLLIMEENERIAKENALKEIEKYNKIQEDLLKQKHVDEAKELESVSNVDDDDEEYNELTPSEIQSVQNMELNHEDEEFNTQLDVALNYLRGNTMQAQRLLIEEEEATAQQKEEQEALELQRQRQVEMDNYVGLDPVTNHAKLIAEHGINESILHGASPPARTPQRLVTNSPVYRKERWQNAAVVLIQSVWRGTHFRRVNKLMLIALRKLYDKTMREKELLKMHKNEMETQIRECKGIELVLAMEQRKCRRLEGSLGEAQRQHEIHLIERAKGSFHGALNTTNRKTSIKLNISPKTGEDVPFTVHAQHKARKQAEHDLVESQGKIRRLNYTIKNLLSKLKSNAAKHKKQADAEISEIRKQMIYHERRSQSEISRLTLIVDNMGKDPDLNNLHPPSVYTKKTMPPVSSAVQTVPTLTNDTFTKVGWNAPSENMPTTNTNIMFGYSTPTNLRNDSINPINNRLNRAAISLPNIHEQPNEFNNLQSDHDKLQGNKGLSGTRHNGLNNIRANSIYSNQNTNAENVVMSPLLQRISSVGDFAASNRRNRNRNRSSRNSNNNYDNDWLNGSRRNSGSARAGNVSNPISSGAVNMLSGARSNHLSLNNINIDQTAPSASALGTTYQPGTLTKSELRRIYGV